jgi:hypothetical protein
MRLIFSGLFSLAALFFAWLFYIRYWKYRDCIAAAQSSCVLPDGDNLTNGGVVWGLFATVLAVAALISWLFTRSRH